MKRFRILYIECNEDHTVGGSHQALYDLVKHLDRERYEPVIAFHQDNIFADRLRAEHFPVYILEEQRQKELQGYHSPSRWTRWYMRWQAIQWRYAFLQQHSIDLVHLNNSPNIGYTTWLPAAHLKRIPCLANAMGAVNPIDRPIKSWMLRYYHKVIAISEHMKRECLRAGIPEDRIEVIYLGIDLEQFRSRVTQDVQEVRSGLHVPPDRILAVMLGNVREWKGQHVVLEALRQLDPDTRQKLYTVFVGAVSPDDVAYHQRLLSFVETHHLNDHVHFAGSRRDIPDVYHAADIAIHASVIPEPFGLVVPEAMSVGTPVIATSIGGPGEILTPASGLLFDPKHPDQLARHLHRLVHNPTLREQLGLHAKKRVEHFSIQKHVQHIEQVYADLFASSQQ